MRHPAKWGQTAGGLSLFNDLRREGFQSLSASVGGDLETRANFDNRGRGPSHGILRWLFRKGAGYPHPVLLQVARGPSSSSSGRPVGPRSQILVPPEPSVANPWTEPPWRCQGRE